MDTDSGRRRSVKQSSVRRRPREPVRARRASGAAAGGWLECGVVVAGVVGLTGQPGR